MVDFKNVSEVKSSDLKTLQQLNPSANHQGDDTIEIIQGEVENYGDSASFTRNVGDNQGALTPEQMAFLSNENYQNPSVDGDEGEDEGATKPAPANENNVKKSHYDRSGSKTAIHVSNDGNTTIVVKEHFFESGKLKITTEDGKTQTFNVPKEMEDTVSIIDDWNEPDAQKILNKLRELKTAQMREASAQAQAAAEAENMVATIDEDSNKYGDVIDMVSDISNEVDKIMDIANGVSNGSMPLNIDIDNKSVKDSAKKYISLTTTNKLNKILNSKYPKDKPGNNDMRVGIYELMIEGSNRLIKDTEEKLKANPNDKALQIHKMVYEQQKKTFEELYDGSGLKPKQTGFEKVMSKIGNASQNLLNIMHIAFPNHAKALNFAKETINGLDKYAGGSGNLVTNSYTKSDGNSDNSSASLLENLDFSGKSDSVAASSDSDVYKDDFSEEE